MKLWLLALFGELVTILMAMLIVSPTPRVTWRRVDTPLVEGAGSVHSDSFGQELVFTKVDFLDQGTYECVAVNTESGQPRATHKTQLVVECKPCCSTIYYKHVLTICVSSYRSSYFSSNHYVLTTIAYLTLYLWSEQLGCIVLKLNSGCQPHVHS